MSEFKAEVNERYSYNLQWKDNQVQLNGVSVPLDVLKQRGGELHVLQGSKGYDAELLAYDRIQKQMTLKINGNKYTVSLKDEHDLLLDSLGLALKNDAIERELRAPMPGLVLKVVVQAGQLVKKGEALVILEAMKMENVLKASADAVVKSIDISQGQTVDKNDILIHFES